MNDHWRVGWRSSFLDSRYAGMGLEIGCGHMDSQSILGIDIGYPAD